jgi:hypothetical protein
MPTGCKSDIDDKSILQNSYLVFQRCLNQVESLADIANVIATRPRLWDIEAAPQKISLS